MGRVSITFRHILPSEAACDLVDAAFCDLHLPEDARCRVVLDQDGCWVHARVELCGKSVGEAEAREPEIALRKAFTRAAQRMRRRNERELHAH